MKIKHGVLVVNVLLLALSTSASGESAAHHAFEDCADCHGKDGVSEHADVPTIAGISAYTFEEYMKAFRDKTLPCEIAEYKAGDTSRPATDMCAIAANMTDQEITDISARFAALPFKPAKQPFDKAKAAAGEEVHAKACEMCHTEGGSYADDDASILAGQWTPYLRATFAAYQSGKRPYLAASMKKKTDDLSEADIENLLNFYASMQ